MAKPRQYTPDENAALLSLAQNGDMASFETLVWKYLKRIYNLAYLLSGDGTVAAEAARRTFVTAYHEISSMRSTIRFSSWLVVLMLREYGGLLVFGEIGGGEGGGAAAGPPVNGVGAIPVEDSPLMKSLRRYLRSLAPEQGIVLLLHYVRGYHLERLVEILQLSEEIILSRLFTAQAQLASLLKQGGAVAGRLDAEVSSPHFEIRRSFPAYLDNSATEKEKELIRRHLAECGGCREALAELEWIAEHLKSLPDMEPPSWLGPTIMEAVRTEIAPTPPPTRTYIQIPRGRLAVVAMIIAAVVLFWYLAPHENRDGRVATAPPPGEAVKPPAPGGDRPVGESVGAPKLPPLPRRYEGGEGGVAPTRPEATVPALPTPAPTVTAPLPAIRQSSPPAVQQTTRQVRPRVEMPAPLPAEWGDSPVNERLSPRKDGAARVRVGETSVLLGVSGQEAAGEIERAVIVLGGSIAGRGYSNGRDILYASIDVDRVMDLMGRLGKIGTIQELPHIPEGASGTIDLIIRW